MVCIMPVSDTHLDVYKRQILNNFGLKDAVEAFIKRLGSAEGIEIRFTTPQGKSNGENEW